MTLEQFDLLVIGAGPGGTKAAFDGAALGKKTAIVESGSFGGTCLNVGCIPTKYLLGATAALPLAASQAKVKVLSGELAVNLEGLQARKNRYIKGLSQAVQKQLGEAGVAVFQGRAEFSGPREVVVLDAAGEITAKVGFGKAIVATGSQPARFPGIEPDGQAVFDSTGILALEKRPESLIIIGAGAIGVEIGEFYSRLGAKITLVEAAERVIPLEDEEAAKAMTSYLERQDWDVHIGRKVASVATRGGQACLVFDDGEELFAEAALVAVGRRSVAASLCPEKAGIALSPRGWIEVDDCLKASPDVYAIGDVNGKVLLAHAATHQAEYAAKHAAGEVDGAYIAPPMPACVYGTMECMRVGPTARELAANGDKVMISKSALASNPIAQSYGHTQGFVKAAWVNDELKSLTAVGHGASHLVGMASLLVARSYKKNSDTGIIFAHPTLDEALESAIVASMEEFKV